MKITWLGWDYDRFPVDAKRRINVQTHTRELFGQDALDQLVAIDVYTNMELVSIPRARAYVARRTAEGKTTREIRRCLKRYIARELYRQLTHLMKPLTSP